MLNVRNKKKAMHDFFTAYAGDIQGTLTTMSKQQLLEHLGSFDADNGVDNDKLNPRNYNPNDIFVGVAAAATGIPERDFLHYALTFFGHE